MMQIKYYLKNFWLWLFIAFIATALIIIISSKEDVKEIDCSDNIYDCSDFNTSSKAQEVFETCGGLSNDVHKLDRDNDGKACEDLQ